MVLWGDVDNDGDQDLFVSYRHASNKLYLNNGDGSLQDVSTTSGLSQSEFKSFGACFGDYNNDGHLDLFVSNYAAPVMQTNKMNSTRTMAMERLRKWRLQWG